MTREEMLQAAIARKTDPVYMQSKAQVVEYYRDTYKGQKVNKRGEVTYEWKTRLVSDLQGVATNKKGEPMSRASIARRFQSGRETAAASPKAQAEYKQVGQKLPPIGRSLRDNSITLTVKGEQGTGKRGGTRSRTVSVTFTGGDAQAFITAPTFPAIWRAYGVDEDLFEEGDYALEVSSVS